MIRLIYHYVFYTKKQRVFILLLCLIILFLSLLIYDNTPFYEQQLYKDLENLYYHQSTQRLYLWFLPFLYEMILMDHDQPFMKPFDVYFGKDYVLASKIFFYVCVLIWVTWIFMIFYHLIPYILTDYYEIYLIYELFFINLFLDGLLLLIITFLCVRLKYQAFSFMIPIFYMLYSFVLEDIHHPMLYLLFPIFLPLESFKSLEFFYKICYIFTGFTLLFIQNLKNKH
ncbi:MAG: hypothetical protein CVV61_04830 [Tenericutes bacterium HGW-Tenericutes-6]|nr:MAG: hypothetical protein CVV61_04830 [Tenericutes bacterium HGW-Tenericutes-6]